MDVTPKTEHHSSIAADKTYTSYTWTMKDWSLLYNHYSKDVTSPEFDVTGMKDCKCKLTFKLTTSIYGNRTNTSGGSIEYKFLGEIEFRTMLITVSFVDETMTKLLTVKSLLQNTIPKDPEVRFGKSFSESNIAEYLKNDTLTLLFELTIVKGVKDSSVRTNTWNPNFSDTARQQFQAMLDDKDLCDITFEVQEKMMPAHKVILAANSQVFKAMFNAKMKEEAEGTVKIDDTHADVFEIFLNYMYTGHVDHIDKVANELIVLADKYQVADLKCFCGHYMSTNLTNKNAVKYLLTAHHLCCSVLQDKAVQFLKLNTDVLANTSDFKMLSNYPDLIRLVFSK